MKQRANNRGFTVLLIIAMMLCGCQQSVPQHRLQWHVDALYDKNMNSTAKVKIAIIDSGIDVTHPDLTIKKQVVLSCIDEQDNTNNEHGTAVVGIIAAVPHNEKGVLGINPNVDIYSYDVMDNKEDTEVNGLIEAIEMSIKEDVDVINMSIGITIDNTKLHEVIRKAYNQGIILVAAAGNEYDEEILFPAAYDEVICVGSADKDKKIMYKGEDVCDVYAPGLNIVTAYSSVDDEREYISLNGTSVSTPIVSAVISRILEEYPNVEIEDIYTRLAKVKYIYSIEEIYKVFSDKKAEDK